MQYGIYGRPKLARNEYGWVNNSGSSVYSSNSLYGSTSPVGGDMSTLMDYISIFTGATEDTDGTAGIVPAPLAGEQLCFLQGTSSWVDIPAYRWLYEWPKDLEPSGLGIDGDFHVSDTLSTMDLIVEGRAHFWELVIDKAKMQGGQIFVSPSLFQIDYVDRVVTYSTQSEPILSIREQRPDMNKWIVRYTFNHVRARRVWMNNDDGVDRTFSEVEVGDMMRCRTFNLSGHAGFENTVMKDVANTDYWTFVCGVGSGEYINDSGNSISGIYIDLAFALTGPNQTYPYVPINTLFKEDTSGQNWEVEIPDNFVIPDIYADLKKVTFQTLCGSTDVEEEYIENEDEIDLIIDRDFRIRGITYMIANVLGVEYVDDSYGSLWSIIEGSNLTDYILFGSDADHIQSAVQKILGVDVDPYAPIALFQMEYATDITNATVEGGTFTPSAEGGDGPELVQARLEIANRHEWMFGYGVFEPRVGQQLGCLGHMYDVDRQNAIVISSIQPIDPELVAPSIAQYTGIDIFGESISQFRLSVIAKNGNVFTGKFMVKSNNGAYIKVDDMIDMYITDITTGLETVGIHLDGENSTIRMKGSVELHQHSNADDDTLSVWDYQNNKKVEIIPTQIPARDNIQQSTNAVYETPTTTFTTELTSSNSTIQKKAVEINKNGGYASGWQQFWGNSHTEYEYSLTQATITLNPPYTVTDAGYLKLGTYKRGDILDVRSIQIAVALGNALFMSQSAYAVPLYTYGHVLSYTAELRTGGTTYKSISGNPDNLTADTSTFTFTLPSLADDWEVPVDGTYWLKVTLTFNIHSNGSFYRTQTNYSSPKFKINIQNSLKCLTIRTSTDTNFMTIGTNGMVYSVGNGDYFYAGNDGFEFRYKNNVISFADNQCKICKAPQMIQQQSDSSKTVKSEIVYCEPSSAGYTIYIPENIESGRTITIFGYIGLKIHSGKRFKIYRYDLQAYASYETIIMATNTSISGTSCNLNTNAKIELVTMDDGIYVLTPIYS